MAHLLAVILAIHTGLIKPVELESPPAILQPLDLVFGHFVPGQFGQFLLSEQQRIVQFDT
jgi:hypothetical protein